MSSFQFNVTSEDGIAAGRKLMDLVRRCSPTNQIPATCSTQALTPIFEFVSQISGRRLPYIEGFLAQVIRQQSISDSIIELWSVDEFISNQQNYAPICNIDRKHQIIQFASWTGELSDGDAWCIDFCDELVRCLPVASDTEHGIDYLKRVSYGCFPSLEDLAPYLHSVAQRRTYLSDRLDQHN